VFKRCLSRGRFKHRTADYNVLVSGAKESLLIPLDTCLCATNRGDTSSFDFALEAEFGEVPDGLIWLAAGLVRCMLLVFWLCEGEILVAVEGLVTLD
jgi:hypothetical protein